MSCGLLERLAAESDSQVDIWTGAFLGESGPLNKYLSSFPKNHHPDDVNNPDVRNKDILQPHKSHSGHLEMIKMILKAGADPNLSAAGQIPLLLAIASGPFDCIPVLLQAGARLDMLDKKKNTAIHYAAIYGHYQSIKLLRQNGADINAQNSLGFTPIMEAVANGHELAVQLLLKEGANADVRNFKNLSCMDIARQNGFNRIVELLADASRSRLFASPGNSGTTHPAHTGSYQLGDSLPSINKGPAEFDRMMAQEGRNNFQVDDEIFQQKLRNLKISKSEKRLPAKQPSPEAPKMPQFQMRPQTADGFSSIKEILDSIGLAKYEAVFIEQDIDLQVFLTLSETDLKEIGINLFGPRRKLANCIARIQEGLRTNISGVEQVYADRLQAKLAQEEGEREKVQSQMSELALLLKQEKQLRVIAEQFVQDSEVNNNRFQQILQTVLSEVEIMMRSDQSNGIKERLNLLRRTLIRYCSQ